MRHVREILRQKLELQRPHRAVAKAIGISNGVVGMLMARWKRMGLKWEELKELPEEELERRIFGPRLPSSVTRPLPDMLWLHRELKKPAVTLEVLHLEYLEQEPSGLRYSRFCQHYKLWLAKQRLSMRQVHQAGEKLAEGAPLARSGTSLPADVSVAAAQASIIEARARVRHSLEALAHDVEPLLSVKAAVQRHPYLFLGGALLLGYAVARLLPADDED